MNPFVLNREIKYGDRRYSVPALCALYGKPIHHTDLVMSDALEVFYCDKAGCVCHFAKGVSLRGFLSLWFR